MARYTGPKGKLVRRFGTNIFESSKYNDLLVQRNKPPGQHGDKNFRKKQSDYSLQLQEKQKVRYMYGLQEKQFRRTFDLAAKQKGVTGDNLLVLLERRIDNAVFRAGFAQTRMQARQMVNHGHFQVNNERVDIPSFRIKAGDVISITDTTKSKNMVSGIVAGNPVFHYPEWLNVDKDQFSISVIRLPQRDDVTKEINENLIVEFYSK